MELWKQIIGFENYAVSNYGNVRNIKTAKEIKPFSDRYGYLVVNLYTNGKMHAKKVHRLVATMFIDNPFCKEQVNHINGDKTDNRMSNLEWATQSENQTHRRRVLKKTGGGLAKKIVFCQELGARFPSIIDAEKATGAYHQHISKCISGKRKTAGGYHWLLVEV